MVLGFWLVFAVIGGGLEDGGFRALARGGKRFDLTGRPLVFVELHRRGPGGAIAIVVSLEIVGVGPAGDDAVGELTAVDF